MRYDIDFYFSGDYEVIFQFLCASDSPLVTGGKGERGVILDSKVNNDVKFEYSSNLQDLILRMGGNRTHENAQKAFDFKPNSHMILEEGDLENSKVFAAVKEVVDYVIKGRRPFYLIAEDMKADITLVGGRKIEGQLY